MSFRRLRSKLTRKKVKLIQADGGVNQPNKLDSTAEETVVAMPMPLSEEIQLKIQGLHINKNENPEGKYTRIAGDFNISIPDSFLAIKNETGEKFWLTTRPKNMIEEERALLRQSIKHENIVRLFEVYEFTDNICLIQEPMDFPLSKLCGEDSIWDESDIAYISINLLSGFDFLHRNQLIHGHFSTEYAFVNRNGSIKLSTALDIEPLVVGERVQVSLAVREVHFTSPEVIANGGITTKTDIWSFGLMLLHIANGRIYYRDLSVTNALEAITNGVLPSLDNPGHWSPEFKHFLSRCIKREKKKRSGACLLLRHPFLRDIMPSKKFCQLVNRMSK